MTDLVAHTLQRIFHLHPAAAAECEPAALPTPDDGLLPRLDFAETKPVVFRSEAFAEDLLHPATA